MSYIIPISEVKKFYKEQKERFKKNKTSKENLVKILNKYSIKRGNKNKVLVLCHGRKYKKKYLNGLLVDKEVNTKSDIVLDIWTSLSYFPKNYFDVIIMEHCELGNVKEKNFPFHKGGDVLWKNIYNILKLEGIVKNDYILNLYSRFALKKQFDKLSRIDKNKVINVVSGKLLEFGFSKVNYNKKYKYVHEMIMVK